MTNREKFTEIFGCEIVHRDTGEAIPGHCKILIASDKHFNEWLKQEYAPSATDTNVGGNLIDRQAALDALGEEPPVWYDGEDEIAERNQWRRDVAAIKALPPAQPDVSDTNVGKMCEYYDLCRNGRDEKKLREELLSAQPECEDAVSRMAVINAWRDTCNSVMSKCACHYDDDIKDTVYDHTSEVNAVLRCNKEFKNALKALPLITPKQPGWIPVTDRLPDKEGTYLCTVQGYVGKTTYLRIADFHPDIYVEYDIEEHKPGFIDYDSEYGFYEVTKVLAWMPLPKPWEGDANG